MLTGLLWATLAVALASPPKSECVLPVADGDAKSPSRPNVEGVITAVKGSFVEAETAGKVRHPLLLGEGTRMFTVYGGFVGADELLAGQMVRVWFANCKTPKPGNRGRAAVVILASTKPGEGWP